jgi:hypothetical protein
MMAEPRDIEIQFDGRTYSGTWRVEGKLLHVSSTFGSKTTQLGNSRPETLAPILLRELAQEGRAG